MIAPPISVPVRIMLIISVLASAQVQIADRGLQINPFTFTDFFMTCLRGNEPVFPRQPDRPFNKFRENGPAEKIGPAVSPFQKNHCLPELSADVLNFRDFWVCDRFSQQ